MEYKSSTGLHQLEKPYPFLLIMCEQMFTDFIENHTSVIRFPAF